LGDGGERRGVLLHPTANNGLPRPIACQGTGDDPEKMANGLHGRISSAYGKHIKCLTSIHHGVSEHRRWIVLNRSALARNSNILS
jgi:hypothetical protein